MIYVTRPSYEGQELTQLLNQANLSAIHLPLYTITKGNDLFSLQSELHLLQPNDLVIVVSPQVSHIISSKKLNLTFPNFIDYYAIGKKSANLFSQLTQCSIKYPQQENSEGLLSLLELDNIKDKHVLIFKGQEGRLLIEQTLKAHQAKVKSITCYQLNPIHYSLKTRQNIEDMAIFIVTSVKHLQQLELIARPEHKKKAKLIVTSPRILDKAKQLAWATIIIVEGASNDILFKEIRTLCHNR